jgi:hypothetical protein
MTTPDQIQHLMQ